MGKVYLETQKESFGTVALTPDELDLFKKQYAELFYPPWSLERRFIDTRMAKIIQGIEAAKDALEEKSFGGFNAAAGELGISPIRPGHVGLADTAGAEADNVWQWAANCVAHLQGVGPENWIHSPTAATTAFAVHRDSFIIPTHIIEEAASPKIQYVKMDIGRSDILWYDVTACRLKDAATGISLIPLPTTYWAPRQNVLVALACNQAGVIAPRLGGFTVAIGAFLDASSYDDATHTVVGEIVAAT